MKLSQRFFITGTDTGIGKTYVTAGLLKAYQRMGLSTIGLKPLASGCFFVEGNLYNEDALALQKASSIQLPYKQINPIAFEEPIAPHIVAERIAKPLSVSELNKHVLPTLKHTADIILIEGVGGWFTPLNKQETMADFVLANQLPVILVVGVRLGCLNHALLTYRAICETGLNMHGWIANCFGPPPTETQQIIDTLKNWLKAPLLGAVGFNENPDDCFTL